MYTIISGNTNRRAVNCAQCGLRLAAKSGQQWDYYGASFTTTRPAYLCRACNERQIRLSENEPELRRELAAIRDFCISQLGDMGSVANAHVETIVRTCGLDAAAIASLIHGTLVTFGYVEYRDVIETARDIRRSFYSSNDEECTCDPTGERPACPTCRLLAVDELPY